MCRQIKQHINDVLIYDCSSVKQKKRKEKKERKSILVTFLYKYTTIRRNLEPISLNFLN